MRQRLFYFFVVCSALFAANPIFSAAFHGTTGLINTPTAALFNPGDFTVGFSSGLFTNPDTNNPDLEFDYKFNYSLFPDTEIGFTFLNSTNLVGNVLYTPFADRNLFNLKFSVGLENITDVSKISSFDSATENVMSKLSPFAVASFDLFMLHWNAGWGTRYRYANNFLQSTKFLNGLFFGMDYDLFNGKIMWDFDGRNFNYAYRLYLSNTFALNLALTELNAQATNAAYNNAPTRFFTISVELSENFPSYFKQLLETKNKDLDDSLANLGKDYTELLSKKDKVEQELVSMVISKNFLSTRLDQGELISSSNSIFSNEVNPEKYLSAKEHYLGLSDSINEQIAQLFDRSFNDFNKKDYYGSITSLQKAIELNPFIPNLYTRLGAIYYQLNLKNDAKMAWKKALQLDPHNKQLASLLDKI